MQRALEQLQGPSLSHAVAHDRKHTVSVLPLPRPGPHGLAAFSAALRQQLRDEFDRPQDDAGAERATAPVRIDQLTLVDDPQVTPVREAVQTLTIDLDDPDARDEGPRAPPGHRP